MEQAELPNGMAKPLNVETRQETRPLVPDGNIAGAPGDETKGEPSGSGQGSSAGSAPTPRAEEIAYSMFPRYIGKADVVVEVGANRGGATLFLSEIARFVYAFEPNPSVFEQLKRHIAVRPNVEVYNLGAGAKPETARFNVPPPGAETDTFGSRYVVSGGSYVSEIEVKIVRLDDLSYLLDPTVLVFDCEGSEVAALDGAERLLGARGVHTVIAEMHYLADGSDTIGPTTDRLRKHDLRIESVTAPDGSPWVVGRR